MSCDYCSLPPNRCECLPPTMVVAKADWPRRPRLLSAPVIPDHMHWYRVMGAVYLRWQACETWESVDRYLP